MHVVARDALPGCVVDGLGMILGQWRINYIKCQTGFRGHVYVLIVI
ncbi:hypothetical protein ABH904_003413 [Pseudomonas frederiksbergensis]